MFKYFTLEEFACQETGENGIKEEFVTSLDALRHECGFPFVITSGYRSPRHSIEAKKQTPGQHTTGCAADIAISNGAQRFIILVLTLGKLMSRTDVLEEKVKTLFELWNNRNK